PAPDYHRRRPHILPCERRGSAKPAYQDHHLPEAVAQWISRSLGKCSNRRGLAGHRQFDRKGSACTWTAPHADLALMIADHGLRDGKAEAGTVRLGCVIGRE